MTTRALGFTIVELVVVLLLLGVLSATAMSRFISPHAFAPASVSAAVSTQAHYAALSAQTSANIISLTVSQIAGSWQLDVLDGAILSRSTSLDVADTNLTVINEGNTYALNAANSLLLRYGQDGELISGAAGGTALNVQSGVQLNINGDSLRELCFYTTGYASEQAC